MLLLFANTDRRADPAPDLRALPVGVAQDQRQRTRGGLRGRGRPEQDPPSLRGGVPAIGRIGARGRPRAIWN